MTPIQVKKLKELLDIVKKAKGKEKKLQAGFLLAYLDGCLSGL